MEDAHNPLENGPEVAAHRAAVEALRKLGASVEAQPPGYRNEWFGRGLSKEWLTSVYIPEAWKGGDEGLIHLQNLFALQDLFLVKAPITDAGLKTLGTLRDLKILSLEETQATDAGLSHVANISSLKCIRLDGIGTEFSDAGLARLKGLSQLRKLLLFGQGFTDASAVTLTKFASLRDVRLMQTAVSSEAIKSANSKRGALRIQTSMLSHSAVW